MLQSCLKQLHQHKVRITENRRILLEVLHAGAIPLSPPAIVTEFHQRGRRANKTTIYRELELLVRAGIVKKVMVSDRKQYFELTERGHHHHLICARCETIEDIVFSREDQLMKQSQRAAEQKGFALLQHSLEFFGVCKHCA